MLPSVRLSSVTFLRPNQTVEIFGNVSTFYAIWYLGHLLTSTENFTEIVPWEPIRPGADPGFWNGATGRAPKARVEALRSKAPQVPRGES